MAIMVVIAHSMDWLHSAGAGEVVQRLVLMAAAVVVMEVGVLVVQTAVAALGYNPLPVMVGLEIKAASAPELVVIPVVAAAALAQLVIMDLAQLAGMVEMEKHTHLPVRLHIMPVAVADLSILVRQVLAGWVVVEMADQQSELVLPRRVMVPEEAVD